MKYTLVGDPHIKNSNIELALELFELVESQKNTTIWLGDLLDTKEIIRGKVLNTWINYFKESKLNHIILVGNHDWFNLDCEDHSLETLKLLNNVKVIDTPIVNSNIGFLPYVHDREKLSSAINEMKTEGVDILFGHLELKSFDFGNGYLCKDGLDLDYFAGFKKVISGHFHKFQQKKNLLYLGTPFSHSFGESNQLKYIAIYNTINNQLNLIETLFRKHITIKVNCDKKEILQLQDTKNLYRVLLTGLQSNIDRYPKDKFKSFNVKWISNPVDFEYNEITLKDTDSNEIQFEKWAKNIKNMNSEVVDLGLSILRDLK